MKIVQIETTRLILRCWLESDKIPFSALNADPDVAKYFPSTLTREESDLLIGALQKCYENHGYCPWAAEIKNTHEFIGMIGLWAVGGKAAHGPCVEIGFRLRKEFWGKGYAVEGSAAALMVGFDNLQLDEIKATVSTENISSIRVLERLGMKKYQGADFIYSDYSEDSRFKKHSVYGMKRGDWSEKKDLQISTKTSPY